MKKARWLLIAIFAAAATPASADNADQLVKACTVVPTKPEEVFRKVECEGYVGGVLDAYGALSGLYDNVRLYCGPKTGMNVTPPWTR